MEYIRVTKDNLEQEHICCAISNNRDVQVSSKKAWLADRFDDGLVFLKSVERGKCFIEYIPAENAWNPIVAKQSKQNHSACIGPKHGPVQAKKVFGPGTAPTLSRSTWSEAMAPLGEQAAGLFEGAEPPVLRYGVVNLYLTFLKDMERMYLIGIQVTSTLS